MTADIGKLNQINQGNAYLKEIYDRRAEAKAKEAEDNARVETLRIEDENEAKLEAARKQQEKEEAAQRDTFAQAQTKDKSLTNPTPPSVVSKGDPVVAKKSPPEPVVKSPETPPAPAQTPT